MSKATDWIKEHKKEIGISVASAACGIVFYKMNFEIDLSKTEKELIKVCRMYSPKHEGGRSLANTITTLGNAAKGSSYSIANPRKTETVATLVDGWIKPNLWPNQEVAGAIIFTK